MVIDGSQRRQRLRRATQMAHARLDALIDDVGLLDSRDRYQVYLQSTWAARRPAELALEASGVTAIYPAWPRRSVCQALGLDLLDVAHRSPIDYPRLSPPTAPLSTAQALGILYVLEGSALGARVLEKRVLAIGMTPSFGARHMARQTAQPKAWTAFVGVLDDAVMDDHEERQCVDAAVATFQGFETAFLTTANDA